MADLTRRALMTTAVAAGTAAAIPVKLAQPAWAAEMAGGQAPGFYRYKVGEFTCTAVNDGVWSRPLDDKFVKNVPFADVQEAMKAAFKMPDTLDIPFTTLVLQKGDQTVLIDSGTGGQLAPTAGTMHENLKAAGIDPASINLVLISHFHPDHVFGLKTKEGEYVFANAEIVVPEAELNHWMGIANAEGAAARIQDIFRPLADKVRKIGDDAEVISGIRSISAPGHTPGHTAYHVSSGDDQLLVLGDTTNVPFLFVNHPGWHAVFDMDADMAEAARRKLLDRAASDRTLVCGYHFPFPAAGHIAKEGNGYALHPVAWSPQI